MLQALSMENHITNICIQPKQYIHYSEMGVKPEQSTQIYNIPSCAVQLLFSYFTIKVVALMVEHLQSYLTFDGLMMTGDDLPCLNTSSTFMRTC